MQVHSHQFLDRSNTDSSECDDYSSKNATLYTECRKLTQFFIPQVQKMSGLFQSYAVVEHILYNSNQQYDQRFFDW